MQPLRKFISKWKRLFGADAGTGVTLTERIEDDVGFYDDLTVLTEEDLDVLRGGGVLIISDGEYEHVVMMRRTYEELD